MGMVAVRYREMLYLLRVDRRRLGHAAREEPVSHSQHGKFDELGDNNAESDRGGILDDEQSKQEKRSHRTGAPTWCALWLL